MGWDRQILNDIYEVLKVRSVQIIVLQVRRLHTEAFANPQVQCLVYC